jgi:kinesin family protein C2/C3
LAKKEREPEHRRKESESSPFNSNHRLGDANDSNAFRQPMGDVGNIEVSIAFQSWLVKIFLKSSD